MRAELTVLRDTNMTSRALDISQRDAEASKREIALLKRLLDECKATTQRECDLKWADERARLVERARRLEAQLSANDVVELTERLKQLDLDNKRLKRQLELDANVAKTVAASEQLADRKRVLERNEALLQENVKLSDSELRREIAARDAALATARAERDQLTQQIALLTARLKAVKEAHDLVARGDDAGDATLDSVAAGYAELLDTQKAQTQFWREKASFAATLSAEIERLKREARKEDDAELKLRQTQLNLFEAQQELAAYKASNLEGVQAAKLSNLKIKEDCAEKVARLTAKLQELTRKLAAYEYGVTLPEDAELIKKLRKERDDAETERELAKHQNDLLKLEARATKDDLARLREEVSRLKEELRLNDGEKLRKKLRALQDAYDKAQDALRDSRAREADMSSVLASAIGKSPADARALLASGAAGTAGGGKSSRAAGTTPATAVPAADGASSITSGLDLALPADRTRVEIGPFAYKDSALQRLEYLRDVFAKIQLNIQNSGDVDAPASRTFALGHVSVLVQFTRNLLRSEDTVSRVAADATRMYEIAIRTKAVPSRRGVPGPVDTSTQAYLADQYAAYWRASLITATTNLQAHAAELNRFVTVEEQREASLILFATGTTEYGDLPERFANDFARRKLLVVLHAVDALIALSCISLASQPRDVQDDWEDFFMVRRRASIAVGVDVTSTAEQLARSSEANGTALATLIGTSLQSMRRFSLPVFGLQPQTPLAAIATPSTPRFWRWLSEPGQDRKVVELKNAAAALKQFYSTRPSEANSNATRRYERADRFRNTLLAILGILYDTCESVPALSAEYALSKVSVSGLCQSCPSFRTVVVDCLLGVLLCAQRLSAADLNSASAGQQVDLFFSDLNESQYFSLGTAAQRVADDLPANWAA